MAPVWAARESAVNLRHFAASSPAHSLPGMMAHFTLPVCCPRKQRNAAAPHDRNSRARAAPANAKNICVSRDSCWNQAAPPAFPFRTKPANGLSRPENGPAMSPILPISLLVTVLCVVGATEGVLDQQLLFIGAAIAATILVCSFEAWSAREARARSEDERSLRDPTDH
jgi:hypothetical protein